MREKASLLTGRRSIPPRRHPFAVLEVAAATGSIFDDAPTSICMDWLVRRLQLS